MASPELSRRQVPFGGHQLAEYTIAAALFGVGIHVSGRPEFVLIAGGGVIGALAFVTKGPLAAVKLLPKRLHLSLDLVVAALFAISPLLYLHDLQIIPIILCEAVAVLLVRMSFTTEIVPRPHPERTGPPSRAARLGALMSHGAARTQTSRMPPATAAGPAAAGPPATATPVTAAAPAVGPRPRPPPGSRPTPPHRCRRAMRRRNRPGTPPMPWPGSCRPQVGSSGRRSRRPAARALPPRPPAVSAERRVTQGESGVPRRRRGPPRVRRSPSHLGLQLNPIRRDRQFGSGSETLANVSLVGTRMPGRLKRLAPVAALGALAAVLGGCNLPTFGAYRGATTQGQTEFKLWSWMTIAGLAVAVLVWGLILWAVVAYRRRDPDHMPRQFHGNRFLEIVYTAMPLIMVGVIFYYTVVAENKIDAAEPGSGGHHQGHGISVGMELPVPQRRQAADRSGGDRGCQARRCWPAIRPRRSTPSSSCPSDETTHIVLVSNDVVHTFYIPGFQLRPLRPARVSRTTFDFTPVRLGVFPGQCAQYCGLYHSEMLFSVRVVSPGSFQAWLRATGQRRRAVVMTLLADRPRRLRGEP